MPHFVIPPEKYTHDMPTKAKGVLQIPLKGRVAQKRVQMLGMGSMVPRKMVYQMNWHAKGTSAHEVRLLSPRANQDPPKA